MFILQPLLILPSNQQPWFTNYSSIMGPTVIHTTPLHSHLLFYLNFKNKRLWLVHLFSLGHMGFIVLCFVVLFMVSVVALFWFFLRGSGFLGCFCSLQKLWLFPSLYLFVLLIYCWFKKKQFKVYMYISKAICWIALFRISKTYLAENS